MFLPNYQINEAARYTGVSPQTVAAWHKEGGRKAVTLSQKDHRAALSYMQLIEVAVVASFRKEGVPLHRIRAARKFVATSLKSDFPFSEYRFKTDGQRLWIDYEQIEGKRGRGKLMGADNYGQLAWSEIIGRLKEFDYDEGVVVRWRVTGERSPIIIDPRVSFGAPSIHGTPTWVIRGRWEAGEKVADIAKDFGIKSLDVRKALRFEGAIPEARRAKQWVH